MEDPAILRRFIELCGGARARVVVVPTASNMLDTTEYYASVFRHAGLRNTKHIDVKTRASAASPRALDTVGEASGIFFTGGNQLKLATIIGRTPLATLMRRRFDEGMHVAGTSAGAAFLSAQMIAFGEEGIAPRAGMVTTCAGLGLTDRFIVDQHFSERGRLGRLITAIAYNPYALGLGVDENTAAFIAPDDTIHVMGQGTVTLVDPAELDTTPILEAEPGTPLELTGMHVTQLEPGSVFDFGAVSR